ncbi:hypothetical protein VTK73DRAFT_6096 [Phialemonium thermophilum]|uniref:Uncharacterized protein n=1 Tax=Phialemonium thermophilum TaxID=223376 RepID=A0ABR3V145_9PEZI
MSGWLQMARPASWSASPFDGISGGDMITSVDGPCPSQPSPFPGPLPAPLICPLPFNFCLLVCKSGDGSMIAPAVPLGEERRRKKQTHIPKEHSRGKSVRTTIWSVHQKTSYIGNVSRLQRKRFRGRDLCLSESPLTPSGYGLGETREEPKRHLEGQHGQVLEKALRQEEPTRPPRGRRPRRPAAPAPC